MDTEGGGLTEVIICQAAAFYIFLFFSSGR